MSLAEKLPKLLDAFQLVFPRSCPSCGVESQSDCAAHESASVWIRDGWCEACRSCLDARRSPRCELCAAVLAQPSPYANGCASCYNSKHLFDSAVSVHNYRGLLQELIVGGKNRRDETLMSQLGRLLGDQVKRSSLAHEIDLMVSIPVHWKRRLRNGFHGAWLVAQNVQKISGIPRSQRILRAVKATEKQGTLSRTARLTNVRHAFACRRPSEVRGRTILLIDDVMTSGATMAEATRVLKRAGAKRVVAAVVARATSIG